MNSRTTRRFWLLFRDLPLDVQQEAKQAYLRFRRDPAHPGLQFKKLEGEEKLYSARIGLGYRALALMRPDGVVWFWIGSHSEYDKLV